MERTGSADPNGEKVAERTWDCPGHHRGRARELGAGGHAGLAVPTSVRPGRCRHWPNDLVEQPDLGKHPGDRAGRTRRGPGTAAPSIEGPYRGALRRPQRRASSLTALRIWPVGWSAPA